MNYLKTFLPFLFGNKKGKSLDLPLPSPIEWSTLSLEEVLMFKTLSNSLNSYIHDLDLNSLKPSDVFHLLNFLEFMNHEERKKVESQFSNELALLRTAQFAKPLTENEFQELIDFPTGKLTLFAILHHDRTRPGKLVIRKADGAFYTKKNGDVWFISILGLSGRGLPFHHSNGCTPMGVFTIDSVMPEVNKQHEFGKYRRLIVNFIKQSENEEELLKYIPRNQQGSDWWKPSLVGRILGRSLLRIHGTGRKNTNILTPYYPFVPTSGCLATNESNFMGLSGLLESHDQRHLLDALMMASDLPPSFENESKIHGLLYVVEFDGTYQALEFRS